MHHLKIIGYVLWRGGLLIAAAGGLVSGARWLLLAWAQLPGQLVWGLATLLAGIALVLGSMAIERRGEDRALGDDDVGWN